MAGTRDGGGSVPYLDRLARPSPLAVPAEGDGLVQVGQLRLVRRRAASHEALVTRGRPWAAVEALAEAREAPAGRGILLPPDRASTGVVPVGVVACLGVAA